MEEIMNKTTLKSALKLVLGLNTTHDRPELNALLQREFGQAGAAMVMIEDQEAPKQCGHTVGKRIVPFAEACARVQAAVDARNEAGAYGPLILARTDGRVVGQAEAIRRAKAFQEIGADMVFLEAPGSEEEMRTDNEALPGVHKMANLPEFSKTPQLSKDKLSKLGYKLAIYPILMLNASIGAMYHWCKRLRDGEGDNDQQVKPSSPESCAGSPSLMGFQDITRLVGFPGYFEDSKRYGDVVSAVRKAEGCENGDGHATKKPRTEGSPSPGQ